MFTFCGGNESRNVHTKDSLTMAYLPSKQIHKGIYDNSHLPKFSFITTFHVLDFPMCNVKAYTYRNLESMA